MKILYDYPSFSQKHGGVSRYVCEIIRELSSEIEVDMSIMLTDNIYLRELPFLNIKHLIPKKKFKGKKKLENFLNLMYANYKITRNNYDIFHATYSDSYSLKKTKKPVVVTIHDMKNEKLSDFHISHAKHIKSKKNLIYNSEHIIAISQNTKKDILELYPINPEKITVIYHGPPLLAQQTLKNEFGKYILFVGRREDYKNFSFFAESIVPLFLENEQLRLVCVGPSFTPEEEQFLKTLGIRKQVYTISVPDNVLYPLYRNALVFVFPSIFEGFGIPILEAFANNCPVCLSDSSCFPEIAGNAALYFDPKDKHSIYDNVKRIIADKQLASELTKLGSERLSLFSWSKAAQQTLNVYKSILGHD